MLSVVVPESLHRDLKVRCAIDGQSIQDAVRAGRGKTVERDAGHLTLSGRSLRRRMLDDPRLRRIGR